MKTLIKNTLLIALIIFTASCSKKTPVTPPLNPAISNISPTSGPKTTIVNINGQDFGTNTNNVQVFFNDVQATVLAVTNTQITVIVPPRAYTGDVKIITNGTEIVGPVFNYIITDIQVSTLAGSTQGFADGTGTAAKFMSPNGITIDAQSNLYLADNHIIRKITPSGVVSTLAGSTQGFTDGTGTVATFNNPSKITIDENYTLYVGDTWNYKIRVITQE